MKRIVLGMAVACGLLGLPWLGAAQGYVGPQDVPYGAGRVLKIMGDRLQVEGKERLGPGGGADAGGAEPGGGADPVGISREGAPREAAGGGAGPEKGRAAGL